MAEVWNALANARLSSRSKFWIPPREKIYRSTYECNAAYENSNLSGKGLGSGGLISNGLSPGFSWQNSSSAAPGPNSPHVSCNIFETLSKDLPMLSSEVVARMRKELREVARRIRVWPPDTNRVRNGNLGGSGHEVRRAVKA